MQRAPVVEKIEVVKRSVLTRDSDWRGFLVALVALSLSVDCAAGTGSTTQGQDVDSRGSSSCRDATHCPDGQTCVHGQCEPLASRDRQGASAPDATTDATIDAPIDATADATTDATADATTDATFDDAKPEAGDSTPPPPAEELICDDGIDNDIDGHIDCLDSDCEDTASCEIPPSIESGNCVNDADRAIIASIDSVPGALGCATSCLLESPAHPCISACVVDETRLSAECADCFGRVVECAWYSCLRQCGEDVDDDDCFACIADHCGEAFFVCAGFEFDDLDQD